MFKESLVIVWWCQKAPKHVENMYVSYGKTEIIS